MLHTWSSLTRASLRLRSPGEELNLRRWCGSRGIRGGGFRRWNREALISAQLAAIDTLMHVRNVTRVFFCNEKIITGPRFEISSDDRSYVRYTRRGINMEMLRCGGWLRILPIAVERDFTAGLREMRCSMWTRTLTHFIHGFRFLLLSRFRQSTNMLSSRFL